MQSFQPNNNDDNEKPKQKRNKHDHITRLEARFNRKSRLRGSQDVQKIFEIAKGIFYEEGVSKLMEYLFALPANELSEEANDLKHNLYSLAWNYREHSIIIKDIEYKKKKQKQAFEKNSAGGRKSEHM